MDYLKETAITLEMDEFGTRRLKVGSDLLPDHHLVWDRTKIIPGTDLYIRGDDRSSGYTAQEWRALYTLIAGFGRGSVINPVESRTCMIKPYQQAIAAKCGFRVPPTIVSNVRSALIEFHATVGSKAIMKSLSAGKVKPAGEGEYIPYNVMTMRIGESDLNNATSEQIAFCPNFMQREIEKAHEMRVVVAGGRMLAFQIDSQSSKVCEVDWRKGARKRHFTLCQLDERTTLNVLAFMQRMNLFTGSIDLIVDRLGEVWFLECNQDGAWGWLDDLCEGAVADMFASALLERMAWHQSETTIGAPADCVGQEAAMIEC